MKRCLYWSIMALIGLLGLVCYGLVGFLIAYCLVLIGPIDGIDFLLIGAFALIQSLACEFKWNRREITESIYATFNIAVMSFFFFKYGRGDLMVITSGFFCAGILLKPLMPPAILRLNTSNLISFINRRRKGKPD